MNDTAMAQESCPDGDSTSSLVEQMYNIIMEGIYIEALAGIHVMTKNNEVPIHQLTEEDIFDVRITSHNKLSLSSSLKRKNDKPSTERNQDSQNQLYQLESSSRLRTRGVDVWGRVPPREIMTQCQNCGFKVSSSRFASHLDKCLLARARSNSRVK